VREALFSIVEARLTLVDVAVLDLFAGSGALGLEALSRGAASLTAIDSQPRCVRLIQQNAAAIGFADRCATLQLPAARALRQLQRRGERYTLILADPPYDHDPLQILLLVDELNLLERPGLIVIEHRHDRALEPLAGGLALQVTRRYGDSALSVYAPAEQPDATCQE
jgi:16S rRNA (guanine(966)-N(2))-methyltransferase RsmD